MAVTLNTDGFAVNFSEPIDKRLIVDRADGPTASLTSLTTQYNYRNMIVWVREEKAFYYLKDGYDVVSNQIGGDISDWVLFSGGATGGCAKSGYVPGFNFSAGEPATASVIFNPPYESASYSVAITQDGFAGEVFLYTVIDKSPSGFLIAIDAPGTPPITATAMWITNCWDGSGLSSGGGAAGPQGPTGPSTGGGATISLQPNAGLTNSGPTYATIYNTTVDPNTIVPYIVPNDGLTPSSNIATSLYWLKGLTAGYFSQKNIVQVLDMILFPAVPFTYTAPTLVLTTTNVPFPASTYKEVNTTPMTSDLTLTYTPNDAGAPVEYQWFCSNGPGYVSIDTCVSSLLSVTKPGVSFPLSTPKNYCVYGTVSHQAGTPQNDSANNPTPLPTCVQAGSKSTTACNMDVIFPYFYGTVSTSKDETNITGPDILGLANKCICCFGSSKTINFGINGENMKGAFALPQTFSPQIQPIMKNSKDMVSNFEYKIPGDDVSKGLWTYSLVYPVAINGINHTYSLYVFRYPSNNPNNFLITT